MAQASVIKTISLTLDEGEALWLRSLLQNPIHEVDPILENERERRIRESIFEALAPLIH